MKNIVLYMFIAAGLLMAACTDKDSRVTGITVEPHEVTLMSVGHSIVLTATVTPEKASEKTVYWFTSNPERVTVDNDGRITCISAWPVNEFVTIYVMTKESLHEASCRVWYRLN